MGVSIVALFVIFASSAILTGAVRQYALRRKLIDIPNERSSHKRPTPRGGGVIIPPLVITALFAFFLLGVIPNQFAWAFGGGGAAVALVGWIDDHMDVPVLVRAAIHFSAAAWAVFWFGGMDSLSTGIGPIPLGRLGAVLATVAIVWSTNFFNFMDGTDGLAGVEAVFVGLIGGLFLSLNGAVSLALLAALSAAAAAGFLSWNWPPARIFMGDAGSGFLGFTFGALAVASESTGAVPAFVWVILLGVFVFDATVTLIRRFLRGERWYAPHRSHAYQRMVQFGKSHRWVLVCVLQANAVLAGLAAFGLIFSEALLPAFLAAGLMLTFLYHQVERLKPM